MISAEWAVEATDVSLAYRLIRSQTTSLREFLLQSLSRQIHYEKLWALRDVSLTARRGEALGVIGANGAGKSTLLRVIGRILLPTTGRVVVRGAISPLLELGSGFNMDLTGTENAIIYASLLGRDPREARRRAPAIAEWAELTEYMNVPVRAYSSGMMARLAFAIATDHRPDVLLIDEVLAVGDASFQERSLTRLMQMTHSGTTVIMVSHALEVIRVLCQNAVWLDHGRVREHGPADAVVDAYAGSVHPAAAEHIA